MNEEHSAAIEHLGALLLADLIDVDGFETATSHVLATTTRDELRAVLDALPTTFSRTPPERRLGAPLDITRESASTRMTGRWQVARTTTITSRSGSVLLDFSEAELDDDVIDLDVSATSGSVRIVIPHGVGVQLVSVSTTHGTVKNLLGAPTHLPGMPLIRLHLQTASGTVKLQRPTPPKPRRRFPLRRRDR